MANTDNQLQDFFGVMNSAQKVIFGLLLSLVIIISEPYFFGLNKMNRFYSLGI